MRLTDISQAWLASSLKQGDTAIDATLGNGFDALFLAQHIGESGTLFGFDVQKQAIEESEQRLQQEPCKQSLFLLGHEHMASTIAEKYHGNIQVIMFNLGWLPGSDKSIITQTDTTLSALKQSLTLLATGGKLSVMVYPGHHGGDTESTQVMHWLKTQCAQTPSAYHFEKVEVPDRPTAPILLKIEKH